MSITSRDTSKDAAAAHHDWGYLEQWAAELQVEALLQKVRDSLSGD